MTLSQAIKAHAGKHSQGICKHLEGAGIQDWPDLTKANLMGLRDYLLDTVSPNSARTYTAVLKSVLSRYEEEGLIPCKDWRGALRCKADRPQKTYLTTEELALLEQVSCTTAHEQYVKDEFLMGDDMLVVPMVSPGTRREAVIPPGTWRSDDGTTVKGPCEITVETPLDRLPYFTR